MKAISERIETVLEELSRSHDIHDEDRDVLQRHFTEPWLDKPNEPGHWWWESRNGTRGVIKVVLENGILVESETGIMTNAIGWRWQQVIGPSE